MSGIVEDGIDDLTIVASRLRTQGLAERRFDEPADVVSGLLAIQAQELAMAKWAVAMRTPACTDEDVEAALEVGRILRTHVLRPTWHFVAPDDIRWLLAVTAPGVRRVGASRDRQIGIDAREIERAERVIADALADRSPLTRRELGERLGGAGIEHKGDNRLAHLVMRAEIDGLICSGPRRGKQQTYVLLDERVPGPGRRLSGVEARAELARRFMRSHGPATVHDLAKWASLRVGEAREAVALVADELERFDHAGKEWWHAGIETGPPPEALLLPEYEESAAGYRDIRLVFGADVPGDAHFERPVLVAGRCIGTWSRKLQGDRVDIGVRCHRRLKRAERAAIEAEAERYASFLGLAIGSLSCPAS